MWMNTSCHAYAWVMSRIWMSRVYRAWFISRISHVYMARMDLCLYTYIYICIHINIDHGTRVNEHVVSCICMSHVAHMNESCLQGLIHFTHQSCLQGENGLVSRIWTRHVTHMDASYVTHMTASCHTYKCVMSPVWMSHVAYINESCHSYKLGIWRSHVYTVVIECCRPYPEWWRRQTAHMSLSSYVTHVNTSRECVTSRIWKRHIVHMNTLCNHIHDSCHAYEWGIWMSHVYRVRMELCYFSSPVVTKRL